MIAAIIFIVIAYLMGSLCSAVFVCKIMGLPDPRTQGSNNPGATNVLRIGGKTPALITLLGDILKGFIPLFLAKAAGVEGIMLGMIALAAFLGHVFPVFFNFQGGKGVATALGAVLGLSFFVGILALVTWVVVAYIFRYSSLAALVTTILMPIYILIFSKGAYFLPILVMAGFLIWRHWDNIKRLRSGTETKLQF